ncbi:MAG: AraC family transcriptional regulator [Bacteroidota bacterium]|nr:AraC family transcriptional regulator [Bacteroidota bacterium]
MTSLNEKASRAFTYSCYHSRNRSGEQFVAEHVFSYQIAGTLTAEDGNQTWTFREGDFRLIRRNHLLKFLKEPPAGGEFKSVSVFLTQETLRNFSIQYGYQAEKSTNSNAIIQLKSDPLFLNFMNSLGPYQDLNQPGNENLLNLKLQEAILILLKTNQELQKILFDFSEPGKIDLEAFMLQNYHFNVELKRFAYLTGRSLATFKRDFEKIFHLSPSRWLQQRRLQEAHYLIKEKGKAPSEVYLDLGFEDLSHFSFAFKKTYGVAPTKILQV